MSVYKIAIIGSEGSGKTTLVNKLMKRFSANVVYETGREIVDRIGSVDNLTPIIFEEIISTHNELILQTDNLHDSYLIVDTESMVTKEFMKIYEKRNGWDLDYTNVDKMIKAHLSFFDLYILIENDFWEDDGNRCVLDYTHKQQVYLNLLKTLTDSKSNYIIY